MMDVDYRRPDIDPEVKQLLFDRLCVAFMDCRPDLKQMSLDEWLCEHLEKLSEAERRCAQAIIDLYYEEIG